MLTRLRDVQGWHGQRTVELIFLSPAWVCSTAPCRDPPHHPVCPQSRAQPPRTVSFSITPLLHHLGAAVGLAQPPAPWWAPLGGSPGSPTASSPSPLGWQEAWRRASRTLRGRKRPRELQLAACGLDLTRGGAWRRASSLERTGNGSLGESNPTSALLQQLKTWPW